MPTIYATIHFDGERIEQDATIHKFKTMDEARAYLLSGYDPADWDHASAVIKPADFSDCWIKSMAKPRIGTSWIAPFSYTQLTIQSPGQHPGGSGYWTTPAVDVLVVSKILERTEA